MINIKEYLSEAAKKNGIDSKWLPLPDILNMGIYITTAVKSPKSGYT